MQGLVFAVAASAGVIKLYDVRSYDKGPFDTFNVGCKALHAQSLLPFAIVCFPACAVLRAGHRALIAQSSLVPASPLCFW
jgi:hypothetical protein